MDHAAARLYRYLGPPELLAAVRPGHLGRPLDSAPAVQAWAAQVGGEPFTYVVDAAGRLLAADRRSEHVACAGGRDVLSAGELSLRRTATGWAVAEVSNQSTGYAPEPASWPAVAAALDRAGIAHPDGFTAAFEFRRCSACAELNLVKDGDYTCCLCEAALPERWHG
ncbi:hypothetical protein [Catellatospora coxensis]|uniref:hypothetical protein n=1 Tax=Catellatospora coxensis TaxID=310354 RepID=UPI0019421BFF|nr:hypothetical protein [Catellatospora coxensis]